MPEEVVEPAESQTDEAAEGRKLDAAMSKFEGHYIESADVMQKPVTLIISGVVPPNVEKDAKGKLVNRPIVSFQRTTKRFIMGKTNERILRAIHGKKASGWLGKSVTLCVRYLAEAFGEKNVPTIRILAPADVPLPMSCRKFYGFASLEDLEKRSR